MVTTMPKVMPKVEPTAIRPPIAMPIYVKMLIISPFLIKCIKLLQYTSRLVYYKYTHFIHNYLLHII